MIEGAVLVREALAAGLIVEGIYVGPGAPDDLRHAGVEVVELAEGVAERVGSTVTPQPVLAVAASCDVPLGSVTFERGFVVVAAGLADPGNVGTILRTAEAAGADAVVMTPGTVDVFNPKVVRASAGALFHVPLVLGVTLPEVRARHLALVATASATGTDYLEVDWRRPLAIVLGNEAHGLSDAELEACDELVQIPHAGRAESLNVAMAASVLCFNLARVRRSG